MEPAQQHADADASPFALDGDILVAQAGKVVASKLLLHAVVADQLEWYHVLPDDEDEQQGAETIDIATGQDTVAHGIASSGAAAGLAASLTPGHHAYEGGVTDTPMDEERPTQPSGWPRSERMDNEELWLALRSASFMPECFLGLFTLPGVPVPHLLAAWVRVEPNANAQASCGPVDIDHPRLNGLVGGLSESLDAELLQEAAQALEAVQRSFPPDLVALAASPPCMHTQQVHMHGDTYAFDYAEEAPNHAESGEYHDTQEWDQGVETAAHQQYHSDGAYQHQTGFVPGEEARDGQDLGGQGEWQAHAQAEDEWHGDAAAAPPYPSPQVMRVATQGELASLLADDVASQGGLLEDPVPGEQVTVLWTTASGWAFCRRGVAGMGGEGEASTFAGHARAGEDHEMDWAAYQDTSTTEAGFLPLDVLVAADVEVVEHGAGADSQGQGRTGLQANAPEASTGEPAATPGDRKSVV